VKNEETIAISPQRSVHSKSGKFQSKWYLDEVFLKKIHDYSISAYQSQLAYLAKTQTDMVSGELYISDPRIYAAKRNDLDMPSFNAAVRGEFSKQYLEAMKKEISSLIMQKTWKTVT